MSFVVTLGGSALGALGSGLTYIGASGLGATVSGLAAGTAGAGAAAGLASGMVGGAMLGAGIGQLTGGNTRSTLMGMGLGAGTGALAGLAAAPASASLATQSAATGAGAASGAASAAKSGFSLSSTLSNPLLLGAAGLGLASAFANTGQSFQDKIRLKPEGQALMYGTNKSGKPNNAPSRIKDIEDMDGLVGATRKKWNAAAAGAIPEKAFEDISNLKQQEEERYGATKNAMHIAMTQMNNTNPINRGQAASGGALAKTALVSAGERMQGLFVPTSILNQYRREELANAAAAMQNIQNLENQTASITYQGSLSKWLGANMQQAQRGAAIGQALSLAGNFALNNAYLSRMNSITQNPANIIV